MLEMKRTCDRRRPQNIKVEYLCNNGPDLSKILNLSLGDQNKKMPETKTTSNGR
jgi:hypothetical protein